MNPKLWDKIKHLTGTEEEVHRLGKIKAQKLISTKDYWLIRSKWLENKAKVRDVDSGT